MRKRIEKFEAIFLDGAFAVKNIAVHISIIVIIICGG